MDGWTNGCRVSSSFAQVNSVIETRNNIINACSQVDNFLPFETVGPPFLGGSFAADDV